MMYKSKQMTFLGKKKLNEIIELSYHSLVSFNSVKSEVTLFLRP